MIRFNRALFWISVWSNLSLSFFFLGMRFPLVAFLFMTCVVVTTLNAVVYHRFSSRH